MDAPIKKKELTVNKLSDFKTEKYKGGIMVTGIVNPDATEVIIPDGVTAIKSSAFDSSKRLECVTIADSVTEIQERAFENCRTLKEVVLPKNLDKISDYLFYMCTALSKIELPSTVKKIGMYAFFHCKSLEEITIPDGVKTIGSDAFCETGLKEIDIPDSVESMDNYVFVYSSNLERVTFGKGIKKLGESLFNGCFQLKRLNVGDGITFIDRKTFNMDFIEELVIGKNVKSISQHLFGAFPKIKNIIVSPENRYFKSAHGSLYSADGKKLLCAVSCDGETPVSILDSVTKIAPLSFQFNNYSIILPEGVTEIESEAFKKCSLIKSLTLPVSLKKIGKNALSEKAMIVADVFYSGTEEQFAKIKADEQTKKFLMKGISFTQMRKKYSE